MSIYRGYTWYEVSFSDQKALMKIVCRALGGNMKEFIVIVKLVCVKLFIFPLQLKFPAWLIPSTFNFLALPRASSHSLQLALVTYAKIQSSPAPQVIPALQLGESNHGNAVKQKCREKNTMTEQQGGEKRQIHLCQSILSASSCPPRVDVLCLYFALMFSALPAGELQQTEPFPGCVKLQKLIRAAALQGRAGNQTVKLQLLRGPGHSHELLQLSRDTAQQMMPNPSSCPVFILSFMLQGMESQEKIP